MTVRSPSAQPVFDWPALVEAVEDAVIAVDCDGTLVVWNPGAEQLFGYPTGEALGRSLDLIIPEESRPAHWHGFHQAMQNNHTRLGSGVIRVPAIHRDGRRLRLALTVGVSRSEDGSISSVGAILREDIRV